MIKHLVLVETLSHLTQKDAPFEYIDTHSGAGLFNLESANALKLQEHQSGFALLDPEGFPALDGYFDVIKSYNRNGKIRVYPGSPAIAAHFLRSQDRAWLCELHPQDYQFLCKNMKKSRKIRVFNSDGLKQLDSLLPPTSRRGLVLIDPSYEVKSEYDDVFKAIVKGYKRFANGIYALWYPVVDRSKIDHLERRFVQSGIKNIQRFELGVAPDANERGMTASGMFLINPPWKLFATMSAVLPEIARVLGDSNNPLFKCDVIVSE
ncbi:MAG: 23S rRNA (adenine(2030)-N(6))-methyltransferase RlmJ [Halioglobus sp.]